MAGSSPPSSSVDALEPATPTDSDSQGDTSTRGLGRQGDGDASREAEPGDAAHPLGLSGPPVDSSPDVSHDDTVLVSLIDDDLAFTPQGDNVIRSPRYQGEFDGSTGDAGQAALDTVIAALGDIGTDGHIWNDEFQFVKLDTGKHLLVLPGVTDLSSLVGGDLGALGWDDDSHTSRDTFIVAEESRDNPDIDSNLYAQLIFDFVVGLIDQGELPVGSEVAIVGHSFGADTALDLASDPIFNGMWVNITHVVAAGYHNEVQLPHVQPHSEVVVIQNIYDVPVLAESVLDGDTEGASRLATEAGETVVNVGADLVNRGVETGVDAVTDRTEGFINTGGDWANEGLEGAADTGVSILEDAADAAGTVVGWLPGLTKPDPLDLDASIPDIPDVDLEVDIPDIANVEFQGDTIENYNDQITVVEFEGGFDGAGHAPHEYADYLVESGIDHLSNFFDSWADGGYTGAGDSWGIDVTVPQEDR